MQDLLTGLYLLALLFALLAGLRRFSKLDYAAKLLCILMIITLLDEVCSFYASREYKNNIPVYNVFSVIEFILVSLYFNYSIDVFKKRGIGIYAAIGGCLLGALDIYYQTINHLDSYFLFFDGIGVITMALYSIARMAEKYDDLDFKRYPHFWISMLLTFFWVLTFLTFGLCDYLHDQEAEKWINIRIQLPANIITYAGMAIVFNLFPKMSTNNER